MTTLFLILVILNGLVNVLLCVTRLGDGKYPAKRDPIPNPLIDALGLVECAFFVYAGVSLLL